MTPHPLFDPEWYRGSNPEIPLGLATFGHYLSEGWRRLRSPHPLFHVKYYLQTSPDVRASGVEPLGHFVTRGWREGRNPHPLFDVEFYLSQDVELCGMDPLSHYVTLGWRRGLCPNPSFDPLNYLNRHPYLKDDDIEPFRHYVEFEWCDSRDASSSEWEGFCSSALKITELSLKESIISDKQDSVGQAPRVEDIADHFDKDFYLDLYQDVANAGIDPLKHYFYSGWKEGRDPAPWFSTKYYLKTNKDVAAAEINPFWHFLTAGVKEGRIAKRAIDARRELLEHIDIPDEYDSSISIEENQRIDEAHLFELFSTIMPTSGGVAVSISHSCYKKILAGTELFISDEQHKFNDRDFAYIHISPIRSSRLVRDKYTHGDDDCWVVVNGDLIGVATYTAIVHAFDACERVVPNERFFIVHSPQGHAIQGLLGIWKSLAPTMSYYWLHNYSSVCDGDNLLRNGVEFCHGPPVESLACSICVYGHYRRGHVENLRQLFEVANFVVVSPSKAALDIWSCASDLPRRTVQVVGHSKIVESHAVQKCSQRTKSSSRGAVRVAFVGFPVMHKGWTVFERIVSACRDDSAYKFFHFASEEAVVHTSQIQGIVAAVEQEERNKMVRLLIENDIDLVVIPALWPETFSFVTFEALASGSDILTLANSGNVASTVMQTGRGRVFKNEEELVGFFTSHQVVELVRLRAAQPNRVGTLIYCGTTASIVFDQGNR